MTVDEQRRRLHAKSTDEYARAREVIKDREMQWLKEELEKRSSPDLSTTQVSLERYWDGRFIYLDLDDLGWTDDGGNYLADELKEAIDGFTFVRALRDEIADRLAREAVHDQIGYDD